MARAFRPQGWWLAAGVGIVLGLAAPAGWAQRPAKGPRADLGSLLSDAVEEAPATVAPSPDTGEESYDPAAQPVPAAPPDDSDAPKASDGTVEVIRERYPNRNVKIEREVAQDAFENYLNHGAWKMWDPQGNLIATGQYSDGQRHGNWKRWHNRDDSKLFASLPYQQFSAPFISQATFQNGQIQGAWIVYDSKQRKISEWEFSTAQRHGKSTWWYANGRKMREITYKDGLLDGKFQEWNPTGDLITDDTYETGRKLGSRIVRDAKGEKKSEGMYLHAKIVMDREDEWWSAQPATFTREGNDEKHGAWTSWYPNGQTQMQGDYQHDVEEGAFSWWYPNGQRALEGHYEHGKQNGRWTWWHKNGQKMTQGQYSQGVQAGKWTVWNEDGKVVQSAEHSPAETVSAPSSASREEMLLNTPPMRSAGRQLEDSGPSRK